MPAKKTPAKPKTNTKPTQKKSVKKSVVPDAVIEREKRLNRFLQMVAESIDRFGGDPVWRSRIADNWLLSEFTRLVYFTRAPHNRIRFDREGLGDRLATLCDPELLDRALEQYIRTFNPDSCGSMLEGLRLFTGCLSVMFPGPLKKIVDRERIRPFGQRVTDMQEWNPPAETTEAPDQPPPAKPAKRRTHNPWSQDSLLDDINEWLDRERIGHGARTIDPEDGRQYGMKRLREAFLRWPDSSKDWNMELPTTKKFKLAYDAARKARKNKEISERRKKRGQAAQELKK